MFRQILRSMRGLWRTERLMLSVMVLCVFSSSLLLNFSYGLWQNYHVQLVEMTDELKEIAAETAEGQTLTCGAVRDYVQALPASVNDQIDIYYCTFSLGNLADHIDRTPEEWDQIRAENPVNNMDENGRTIDFLDGEFSGDLHFIYRGGCFLDSKVYEGNLRKPHNRLLAGRFYTDEEYASGARVVLTQEKPDDPHRGGEIRAIQTGDDTVSLWGTEYKIIGTVSQPGIAVPPITAIPDSVPVTNGLTMFFSSSIDRKTYNILCDTAEAVIPGILVFPELPFPDTESMYLYRNILLISALIAVLSGLNFAMLYRFLLQRRSRTVGIFRLLGCTAGRAVRMYIGECLLLGIPVYLLGAAVFVLLLKYCFSPLFPYMADAYSPKIYLAIFGIYLVTMLVIMAVTVSLHMRKTILSALRGEGGA